MFHPSALLMNNAQPVFTYDPKTEQWRQISKEAVESSLRARTAGMAAFLQATHVGVLLTTKYGQNRIQQALSLPTRYPDKLFHFLLSDTIDFSSLEDFPFIQSFVNTACPRMIDDHAKVPRPMVNIGELGIEW
jgi:diphthamide biosynthesis enzyme Dph1/Dph2-like protein